MIITVMALATMPVLAQSGLNINSLFDGRYKTNPYAAEYIVTGPAAWEIDLEVYHSLKVTQKEQQDSTRRCSCATASCITVSTP